MCDWPYHHIEAWTEWLPYCRWHFKMHFLEWKIMYMYFKYNFIERCSQGSGWQYVNIGSGKALCHQAASRHLNESCPMTPHGVTRPRWVNSLVPGRFQFDIRKVIFKLTLVNGGWGISYELTSDECHKTILISQHWFITWAYVDPDLCHHMVSLGLNELMYHGHKLLNGSYICLEFQTSLFTL